MKGFLSMILVKDLGTRYTNERSKQKKRFGLYVCPKCNKQVEANTYDVNNGKIKGCADCSKTNLGLSNTKLYYLRKAMIDRCYNKKHVSYMFYGARGIGVCSEWRASFISFHNWLISKNYRQGLQIDRIDNSEGYSPENCRLVTARENNRNRRSSKITIDSAKDIYIRANSGKETDSSIAKDYGVVRTVVNRIKNRTRWADATAGLVTERIS